VRYEAAKTATGFYSGRGDLSHPRYWWCFNVDGNAVQPKSSTIDGANIQVPAYDPDFNVTLLCQQRQYSNSAVVLYDLTARAQYGQLGNADYVWTEQNATLEF